MPGGCPSLRGTFSSTSTWIRKHLLLQQCFQRNFKEKFHVDLSPTERYWLWNQVKNDIYYLHYSAKAKRWWQLSVIVGTFCSAVTFTYWRWLDIFQTSKGNSHKWRQHTSRMYMLACFGGEYRTPLGILTTLGTHHPEYSPLGTHPRVLTLWAYPHPWVLTTSTAPTHPSTDTR